MNLDGMSAQDLAALHNTFLLSILDRDCPEIKKEIIVREDSPWYDSSVASLRKERRRKKRIWRRLRTEVARMQYVSARRAVVNSDIP